MVGFVVDDDRRPAEHDRQPEPRLDGVAEVAEQERGGEPGEVDADREHDQPAVDERERGGTAARPTRARRRGSAGAPSSGSTTSATAGTANQSRRGRRVAGSFLSATSSAPATAASTISSVEPVPAREGPEPAHASERTAAPRARASYLSRSRNRRAGTSTDGAFRRCPLGPGGHSFAGMDSTSRRIPPFSRIIGLVAIGLVVAGLAYLRFSPAGEVSVPEGAHAGQLTLKSCDYATEDGDYEADCGTLVVPENRARPDSRLIALPVTRIRARSEHPREPIFRLEGGPGITNMKFKKASRFAENRDVVLVGYRGVEGSAILDCPEVANAMRRSSDFLASDSLRDQAAGYRSCASASRTRASTSRATRCPSG